MHRSNTKNTTEKSKSISGSGERNKRAYRSIPISHMIKFRGERAPTLNQKLNEELLLSYNKIKLTDYEIENRTKVFELFKKTIENGFDCQVESHGSFRTGTMVYGSDIDITVLMNKEASKKPKSLPGGISYKPYSNQMLSKVANIIESSNITVGPVIHVKNARIPVLKCVDKIFNCKIDIVIDKYDSIETANFVIKQLRERPYLKYLATLLKYFLKRRHLSEVVRGGLCSYAQFLLILNFVQLHPLIQNGNIRVEDNLGTIFMDFFQLYGLEFPFERAVISVLEIGYKPNRDSQISIEDPCNPGHNVAAGCTALPMIREIFSFSYKIMAAAFAEKVATNKAIGELWLRIDEQELVLRNRTNRIKNENRT